MSETVRKNISMSKKTAKWYEEKADEMGVSQSNLMAIALSDYIRNDNAMAAMMKMGDMTAQLQEITKKTTK